MTRIIRLRTSAFSTDRRDDRRLATAVVDRVRLLESLYPRARGGGQALGLGPDRLVIAFQSRFGRAEWLKPYTAETVAELARTGTRNLVVITPGFAADCVETLEEIAIGVGEIFHANGGQNFSVVPCLNASPESIDLLASLIRQELAGWVSQGQ